MMKACATCPNRWQARLARSIGDEDLADEIEAAGCGRWKRLDYEVKDMATGQIVGKEEREQCLDEHLIAYFTSLDAHCKLVTQLSASHRNVVSEGFSAIVGRPILGDGDGVAPGIRQALRESGRLDPEPRRIGRE
jgi:hypothetical protein